MERAKQLELVFAPSRLVDKVGMKKSHPGENQVVKCFKEARGSRQEAKGRRSLWGIRLLGICGWKHYRLYWHDLVNRFFSVCPSRIKGQRSTRKAKQRVGVTNSTRQLDLHPTCSCDCCDTYCCDTESPKLDCCFVWFWFKENV